MITIQKQENNRFYLLKRNYQVLGFSINVGQLFRKIDSFGVLEVNQELAYKEGKYLTWYDTERELADVVNAAKQDDTYYQVLMYGDEHYDFNLYA